MVHSHFDYQRNGEETPIYTQKKSETGEYFCAHHGGWIHVVSPQKETGGLLMHRPLRLCLPGPRCIGHKLALQQEGMIAAEKMRDRQVDHEKNWLGHVFTVLAITERMTTELQSSRPILQTPISRSRCLIPTQAALGGGGASWTVGSTVVKP